VDSVAKKGLSTCHWGQTFHSVGLTPNPRAGNVSHATTSIVVHEPKKLFCWWRHMEGVDMPHRREVVTRRWADEGRCRVERTISSVFFGVIPWQLRFSR